MATLLAPWTPDQVKRLNSHQANPLFHPFTCGRRDWHRDNPGVLVATENGWQCPVNDCGYTQNWAHPLMLGTPIVSPLAALNPHLRPREP